MFGQMSLVSRNLFYKKQLYRDPPTLSYALLSELGNYVFPQRLARSCVRNKKSIRSAELSNK